MHRLEMLVKKAANAAFFFIIQLKISSRHTCIQLPFS